MRRIITTSTCLPSIDYLQIDLEIVFEEFEHGITVSFDDHFCTKSTVQSRELTMVQQQAEIKL